jgi:hypothetical protein
MVELSDVREAVRERYAPPPPRRARAGVARVRNRLPAAARPAERGRGRADNVEFVKGYIEEMPLGDENVDLVVPADVQ